MCISCSAMAPMLNVRHCTFVLLSVVTSAGSRNSRGIGHAFGVPIPISVYTLVKCIVTSGML